jgi:ABC-2 type transport system permease protein
MKITRFLLNVKYLWLEQLLELRPYWHFHLAYSILLPLTLTFGLTRISGQIDNAVLTFRVVIGSAIFMLANEIFSAVAVRVTTMYREGMLVYYASLPISKTSLIVALMLSRSLIALPGIVAPLLLAPIVFNYQVVLHPLLLLIIPLIALLLAALGMIVGLLTKAVEVTQGVTYAVVILIFLATPVFIPTEILPIPLRIVSLFLPFTYASETLNLALHGTIDATFWTDITILGAMMIGCLLVLERRLQWRTD